MSFPYSITIGGEAGYGIMSAGLTIAKLATRSGYSIFTYSEYPSIIRGGHNVTHITVSDTPIRSQYRQINVLIALNQETITQHIADVAISGVIIFDNSLDIKIPTTATMQLVAAPLTQLAKDNGGSVIMRNSVALGALAALLGADKKILVDLIAEEFGEKKEIAKNNIAAVEAGFAYVQKQFSHTLSTQLVKKPASSLPMVVNGNEAIALGAVSAGMQFAAIYPMTPTSNILHVLAPLQQQYNFIYEQPEDEIAAINMAIGASFTGARSMVATAGGGFCLMTEGYGLAGMTETPLVIIEGMRGGPATGLPTWTEQGDLQFILHAHQGDFPRIVLAAANQSDAYVLTQKAFYLADKYQTPVVVMVDKYICESSASVDTLIPDEHLRDRGAIISKKQANYTRYAVTDNGISPRALPGTGTYVIANSDEHNPAGYSDESAANRITQMDKRAAKLITCAREDMEPPQLYGPKKAKLTIVSWGSTSGPILEAIKNIPDVNYLHITWMNPFPIEFVSETLKHASQILVIECSKTGDLGGIIREKTGINITNTLLKYDGRPFYPDEIIAKIKNSYKKFRFFSFLSYRK